MILFVNWRVWVVVGLLFLFALARRLFKQWRERVRSERRPVPRLPAAIVDGAERAWVIFTTPHCVSCRTVEETLRSAEPGSRVVKVDATREPALAEAFHVRSAPTTLLAAADGEVLERLVGLGAVREHVAAAAGAGTAPGA
jgi:hypothetical protein